MITKFGVHIKVKSINKSLNFYSSFGLKPIFAYGNKNFTSKFKDICPSVKENYNGVTFKVGGSLLEIADGHIAVKKSTFKENIESSKISAMLHVKSLDKIMSICKEKTFKIFVDPKSYPWGTKEMVVKDPDGFVLVFIERLN